MSTTTTRLVDDMLEITTAWPDNDDWPDQVERVDAHGGFFTLDMMKRADESGRFHFFSRDAMRFFNSRIAPGIVHGRVFITSEQFDRESPRLYTVRAMKDDGSTTELCNFQQFETLAQARRYVRGIYSE